MKKAISSSKLAPWQVEELAALAARPDSDIDTSDAPEVLDWTGARRGMPISSPKRTLRLELDADLVAWFKATSNRRDGYKNSINQALREYVETHARKAS
jgi:uncharacterized protein (DUF4415 family)